MNKFIKGRKVRIKTYEVLKNEFPKLEDSHFTLKCGELSYNIDMSDTCSKHIHLIDEEDEELQMFLYYGYYFNPEMCEEVE